MEDETSRAADAPIVLVSLNPPSHGSPRSVSPVSPSPTRDLKGVSLFQAISRRLRNSQRCHDEEEDDNVSQSTDSEDRSSGSAGGTTSWSKKYLGGKKGRCLHRSASFAGSVADLRHLHSSGSSGGSSSGSDTSSGHLPSHNAPLSPSSRPFQRSLFKEVFQSFTRSTRSHSANCASPNSSNTSISGRVSDVSVSGGQKKKKKSILRAPVTYTYVRGLSGLPTQRVPRGYQCVYVPSVVCRGSSKFGTQHHLPGLNR